MLSSSPISLDKVRARFETLLADAGTRCDAPDMLKTWRAFEAFAQIEIACDDESLFFECGPSPSHEDRFYVNFTRTFFGRDAGNHFWSVELNCDFLFECSDAMETLGTTIEAEELADNPAERARFFEQVKAQREIWDALGECEALSGTIYVGES